MLFLSPLVYQSVHVIDHQDHVLFDEVHLCDATYDHSKFGDNEVVKILDTHCLICDYEFPIQFVNEITPFIFNISYIKTAFNDSYKQRVFNKAFHLISPRAPPAI